VDELRSACAAVADRAEHVSIDRDAIPRYAMSLSLEEPPPAPDPRAHLLSGTRAELAAFWLTLDAINFGSGWFPTLRKRAGRSGYFTIAIGVRERFAARGPWSAGELSQLDAGAVARVLRQDPGHELMEGFARSLRDLGRRVAQECEGRFEAVVETPGQPAVAAATGQPAVAASGDRGATARAADTSAVALATRLGGWECFADTSTYGRISVPFLKRAQLAAADLARAGAAELRDRHRLTMFADNLVPHVLRLDGVLRFEDGLVRRIDRGELIEHGSPEEIEIRACALHAVELIVAHRPGSAAADVDQLLWHRGGQERYKSSRRHRSRCTAY